LAPLSSSGAGPFYCSIGPVTAAFFYSVELGFRHFFLAAIIPAMLASGGYPWTVIRVENRDRYLSALDHASIDMDIGPFADFIAKRVEWSLENTPAAAR